MPNASWPILADLSIRIYVYSTLQRDQASCIIISATGSIVQGRVLGRRRGICRMGNCGWNFTILGLKDADLRVESDAANRLCVRWLVAEIFTKRPKHQIQQDHIWGYTAITKKHHIYQVLKPLEMRTQRWWFHANRIRNGQDMGCAAIPICSPTPKYYYFWV